MNEMRATYNGTKAAPVLETRPLGIVCPVCGGDGTSHKVTLAKFDNDVQMYVCSNKHQFILKK